MEELKQRSWPATLFLTLVAVIIAIGWALGPAFIWFFYELIGPQVISDPATYWWVHTVGISLFVFSIGMLIRFKTTKRSPQEQAEIVEYVAQEKKKMEAEQERDEENLRRTWRLKVFLIVVGICVFALTVWMQ